MANRFWVGGTGAWNSTNTTNWSTTSGGAGGASVPGAADAVIIDTLSGTGTCTMAASYNPTIGSILFAPNNFTLDLNNNNVTCTTYSNAPTPVTATLTARVIAFGATGQFTITGNNTTVCQTRYETGLTLTGSKKFVLTYAGSVGTRTIGCVAFNAASPPNYYITGGTDIIAFVGPSGIVTGIIDFTGFGGRVTPNQWFVYGNVTLSPTQTVNGAAVGGMYLVPTSGTYSLKTNGAPLFNTTVQLPYTGSTGGTWIFADTNLTLPQFNFNAGVADFANTNPNVTFTTGWASAGATGGARTIKWGTGNITLTNTNGTILDFSNQSTMSYTGTPPIIRVTGNSSNVQSRTISIGTTGGTQAKALPISVTAGTGNLNLSGHFSNVALGGWVGTLTNATRTLYGNLTIPTGTTVQPGTAVTTLGGSSLAYTIDTNGVAANLAFTVNAVNSVVTFANGISANNVLTLTNGTMNVNDQPVMLGSLLSPGTGVAKLFMGNSTWTFSGTGNVISLGGSVANCNVIPGNSTVYLANDTAERFAVFANNTVFNNVVIGGNTVNSNITFGGNVTFNSLSSNKAGAGTVKFTSGTTTTVSSFGISGSEGNIITLTSTAAAQHKLVLTGGGNVNTVDYLAISYSNASPAVSTWYPGDNSINLGNTTGWIWQDASGNFFLVF